MKTAARLAGPTSASISIQAWGRGRYGVIDGALVFSATDNTDPNTTGARYQFRANFI